MADEWVVARVVPYLHDAVRLRERLADSAIDVHLPDEAAATASGSLGASGGVRIQVPAADLERARNIIDGAWPARHETPAHPPGALGTYHEWSQHQYDPGHYLGGTIDPLLRSSSMGPQARSRAGAIVLANGLLAFVATAAWAQDITGWALVSLAIPGLMVVAGWWMLLTPGPPGDPPATRRRAG